MFLGLQVTGSSLVVQHGREAVLRPGEFAVYDTSSPYTLVHRDGIDQHFFRIPRSALVMSPAALRGVTAVTVGAGNPVAGLAAGYLRVWPATTTCAATRGPARWRRPRCRW